MTETILIVDDSTFIVEGLVALLKRTYHPIPAYSGEECLAILRTTTPSLIILDIMMEPMDGWETLSRIKADSRTRHVPVLMFSAKKISWEEAEEHRIIIDDFISKPVNPKQLLEAIEKVLARQAFNRQVLSSWSAAGVSHEVIDEYLTLKMNLDVDISLLAVMKKQVETVYTGAAGREDLSRAIALLEQRIASSRSGIESFCRERDGVLPPLDRPAERETSAAEPGPAIAAAVPPPIPALAMESPPFPAPSAGRVVPVPSPAPRDNLAASGPAGEERQNAILPEEIRPPAEEQDQGGSPPAQPLVVPVIAPAGGSGPAPEVQEDPSKSPAQEGTITVAGAGTADSVLPAGDEPVPEASGPPADDLFEPFPAVLQTPSPFRPEKRYGRAEGSRKADQERPSRGGEDQNPQKAGSGTATPPLRTHAQTRRIERAEQAGGAERGTEEGRQGFLSRIIVAITAIFRRDRS